MKLSPRFQSAFKVALAIVIAFGVALWMDWEKPYWAGFAVAFISLETAGASLNKAAMRMLGTLVAIAAVFAFLALFPQQRWLFMTVVSLYVGLCAYMMTGEKHQYFWYASGFICVVIAVNTSNSLTAFQIAVERAQETGTGILVYSLISTLVWPRSSQSALEETFRKLRATQTGLYQNYLSLTTGKIAAGDARTLRLQESQLRTRAGQLLTAAETDSYDVWESRRQWRYFHKLSTELSETLERWRESLPPIQDLGLAKHLPNYEALSIEIEQRFEEIAIMLDGQAPNRLPEEIDLKVDRTAVGALDHFQMAAFSVFLTHTERLEALSRLMFDCVQALKGLGGGTPNTTADEFPPRGLTFDPDRFQGAVTVMATLWLAFLIWIYVDPPGHASFVLLPTVFTMVCVKGGINPSMLALPIILFTLFAGFVYVFVMPHLSGYGQLGSMLFVVSFAITYMFASPRQAGLKSIALAMFLSNISIQNQQTYNFAAFMNGLVMLTMVAVFIIATAYIPHSPRPEKIFLRLLSRFFRQAEFMISRLAIEGDRVEATRLSWRMHGCVNNLMALPPKLARWGARIDHKALPHPEAEQIQAMVNSLAIIADRIGMLTADRRLAQPDFILKALQEDFKMWRVSAQEIFRNWSCGNVADAQAHQLSDKLELLINRLEARLDALRHQIDRPVLAEEEHINFYRILGSYRSLSEAIVAHARLVNGFRWERWQEERF